MKLFTAILGRVWWGLKQLLPLTYRCRYWDRQGQRHFVVWNMWLGRVYAIDDILVERVDHIEPSGLRSALDELKLHHGL
jgi:hypothetical protein